MSQGVRVNELKVREQLHGDEAVKPSRSLEEQIDAARNTVLRSLSMAPRSRHQLWQTLERKQTDPDVANTVLDRLTEVGLIDDRAFAQMLVRARRSEKGLARRALKQELTLKGIDSHLIEEVLEGITDEEEFNRAVLLVQKKLKSMSALTNETKVRRLAGLLARKGYSSGVTFAVVRSQVQAHDLDQLNHI